MPLEGQDLTLPSCWVVGCGFLGGRLLAACRAAGAPCLGIDLAAPLDGDLLAGDAADPAVLATALARLEPDVIFCCAATHGGDEDAYSRAYLALPRALAAAVPAARLVFCSSTSVYGGLAGVEVTEESPRRALTPLARILAEAEDSVLALSSRHAVARLAPLYGSGRCELLRRHVAREPELPGADSRWLNYVHVEDAVSALLLLSSLPPGSARCVNVCAESFRKGEVCDALSALTGLPRVSADAYAPRRRGTSDQRVSSAFLRTLGWRPRVRFLDWAGESLAQPAHPC